MKKLTHETTKSKNATDTSRKAVAQAAEKEAKCCAKRSKNRVGCHD